MPAAPRFANSLVIRSWPGSWIGSCCGAGLLCRSLKGSAVFPDDEDLRISHQAISIPSSCEAAIDFVKNRMRACAPVGPCAGIGKATSALVGNGKSAIGTLLERSTRFVVLT